MIVYNYCQVYRSLAAVLEGGATALRCITQAVRSLAAGAFLTPGVPCAPGVRIVLFIRPALFRHSMGLLRVISGHSSLSGPGGIWSCKLIIVCAWPRAQHCVHGGGVRQHRPRNEDGA